MKYREVSIFLVVIILLSNSSKATTTDSLFTLQDVWTKTELYSKELWIKQLDTETKDERVAAAKDEQAPVIDIHGMYARLSNMPLFDNGIFHAPTQIPLVHDSYQLGSDVDFNLYNGGKTKRTIIIRQTEKAIAKDQLHLSAAEIKYRAAIYYFDIYCNKQFKKLTEQEMAYEEKQMVEIANLYKNGVVLKSDLLRAELRIATHRITLQQIENNIILSTQQLNTMMGRPDSAGIEPVVAEQPVAVLTARSYEDYLYIALEQSFEYKISSKEAELSALKLKQVQSNTLPRIDLFGTYNYTYPQIAFYPYAPSLYGFGQAGIKTSIPLAEMYLNRHKAKEAALVLRQQKIQLENKQDEIRQQVHSAYLRYTEAISRVAVAEKNIERATESLRILRNTYFNQQALLTDLLDAETQLLQSKFDLTTARANVQIQFYQLRKIIGNI